MLLNELTGVKKYYNKTGWQIERMLSKFGIKFVASGKFGKVFTNDKWDYVVKIFNDEYYLSFVNYAIAHPNPHYPHFKRKPLEMHRFEKRFKHQPNYSTIVKIEKLLELPKEKADFIVAELEHAQQGLYNLKHNKQDAETYQTWFNDPISHQRVRTTWPEIFKMYPWLYTLAEAWQSIQDNVEYGSPDIHASNFMQRKDGTVVIIDPLWHGTNPLRDYDEAMRRETDMYAYEEEPDVKGPAYINKKHEEAIKAAQLLARSMGSTAENYDDIPF